MLWAFFSIQHSTIPAAICNGLALPRMPKSSFTPAAMSDFVEAFQPGLNYLLIGFFYSFFSDSAPVANISKLTGFNLAVFAIYSNNNFDSRHRGSSI
jgi:hypothetical protein